MAAKPVIFIVEDDPAFNQLLLAYFSSKDNWDVHSFTSGEEALSKLYLNPIIFLQDFDLPGISGLEVMRRVKRLHPEIQFIFLSGQSNIKVAVDILKEGAFDYVMKDTGAKASALNKVDQIMKMKKLEHDNKFSRIGLLILGATICLSWALFWLFIRK